MRKHRVGLFAAGVCAVVATGASATTMLQMSFEDLVADASLVVVGEAIDARVVENATEGLTTITSFRVKDAIVGSPSSIVQVATPGGTFRSGKFLLRESTANTPLFPIGSEHMLFLNSGATGSLSVVGFNQGAAPVFKGKEGRSVILPGGEGAESLTSATKRVREERAEIAARVRETAE